MEESKAASSYPSLGPRPVEFKMRSTCCHINEIEWLKHRRPKMEATDKASPPRRKRTRQPSLTAVMMTKQARLQEALIGYPASS